MAIREKGFSFGTCKFSKTSPPRETLNQQTRVLNITLTFEEALKLNLAVDECLRKINGFNRSTSAGKKSGLNLAILLGQNRISVNLGSVHQR